MSLFKRGKKLCVLALAMLTIVGVTSCTGAEGDTSDKIAAIKESGVIKVGTTGDYKPMSYLNEETGEYEGYDKELAELIAETLGVEVEFVPTTWPTLTDDTLAGKFDIAICGITRTTDRMQIMSMSDGYLSFGKTILCQADAAGQFKSIEDINKPEVTVMVNPGGTNEAFAKENFPKANIVIHEQNAEIPSKIAAGEADIMVTETMEAKRYVKELEGVAAPLVEEPFTHGEFGVLMQNTDQNFLNYINFVLEQYTDDGTLPALEKKYID